MCLCVCALSVSDLHISLSLSLPCQGGDEEGDDECGGEGGEESELDDDPEIPALKD